jgi:glycerol-3-phosphate dehydrogenase
MERDLPRLANTEFDLLVIGGGIHGVFVAWDAALRGLSVALVEKGDFGSGTSANSLKTIHGGMRYLQDGDLGTVQMMIRERATWLRIAPHLVQPVAFLIPTYRHLLRSKLAFRAALTLNDLIEKWHSRRDHRPLPSSRILSQEDYAEKAGWIPAEATGAALWHDGQIHDSERLLLAVVLSAVKAGAVVANYVTALGFLGGDSAVTGIVARDELAGQSFDLRARQVINCAGAWSDQLLSNISGRLIRSDHAMSIAANIITRQFNPQFALGLSSHLESDARSPARARLLFVVPWRGYSLIGTWHLPCLDSPGELRPAIAQVQSFVDEINTAYPPARLTIEDVHHVHYGYLPLASPGDDGRLRLLRHGEIRDHAVSDGIDNLLTVTGVKYTTARILAEQTVDRVMLRRGEQRPGLTAKTPLAGGDIDDFKEFIAQAVRERPPDVSPASIRHLAQAHGRGFPRVLALLNENPSWASTVSPESPVIEAEVIHALRQEMAQTLADVVCRRTPLGAAGIPTSDALQACAGLMASELGWNQARCQQEIEAVKDGYALGRPIQFQAVGEAAT